MLVFSQYVGTRYATQLLAENPEGVGYLLKDRVAGVREFMEALARGAGGALSSIRTSWLAHAPVSFARDTIPRITIHSEPKGDVGSR